jgi:MFS family permease
MTVPPERTPVPAAEPPTPEPAGSGRLGLLYGAHFLIDGLQAAMLLVLVFVARDLGLTGIQVGWVAASNFLLGALLSAPASLAARALGARRLVLIALHLCGLCCAAAALTTGFGVLLLVYLGAGVGVGVFHPVAFSLVAEAVGPRGTSRAMGRFTAVGDVGRLTAVAAATAMVSLVPWQAVVAWLGVPVALAGLALALRERKGKTALGSSAGTRCPARAAFAVADRGFWLLCGIGFLDALANSSLSVLLPFLLFAKGQGQLPLGILMPLFFVACLPGRVVIGWLGDLRGRAGSLAACQAAVGLAIAGLCASGELVWVGASVVLLGLFTRASLPLILSLTAERLPREAAGFGFAVNQMVLGVAATLSPLLLGGVSELAGTAAAFGWAGGLCVLNAGLVLAVRKLLRPGPLPAAHPVGKAEVRAFRWNPRAGASVFSAGHVSLGRGPGRPGPAAAGHGTAVAVTPIAPEGVSP